MIDRLPYTLTAGVTATREGLEITDTVLSMFFRERHTAAYGGYFIRWRYAAERLRYRDGEPWCAEGDYDEIVCVRGSALPPEYALHRLAAILCDDAEAFRVLHWCVTEMGGER
jgi:hypothetical protein